MAITYTLIASNTLGASAASVTFSSIPNTYTDLILKFSIRNSDVTNTFYLKFNNDATTTKYSSTYLRTDGSTTISNRSSSSDVIPAYGGVVRSDYTANTFSNGEIYIPSYTASQNKPSSISTVAENNATTSQFIGAMANLYSDTTAISRIDVIAQSSTFTSGSSFFLYGIKNT